MNGAEVLIHSGNSRVHTYAVALTVPSHSLPLLLTITTACRAEITREKLHIYFLKWVAWE
jgi:hypothetical protein